jgi:hypothetical protein
MVVGTTYALPFHDQTATMPPGTLDAREVTGLEVVSDPKSTQRLAEGTVTDIEVSSEPPIVLKPAPV